MSYRPVYICDVCDTEFDKGDVFLQLIHDNRGTAQHTQEHLHNGICFTARMQSITDDPSTNWEIKVYGIRAL